MEDTKCRHNSKDIELRRDSYFLFNKYCTYTGLNYPRVKIQPKLSLNLNPDKTTFMIVQTLPKQNEGKGPPGPALVMRS